MRPANFPKTKIKEIHFKNPFAILAQPTSLTNPNGRVTPELLMYYKAHAQTEAALVITGPATVTPPVSRRYSLLRVDQPKYLDGLRTLAKIIESNGALPGIQVVHPAKVDANDILTGLKSFNIKDEDRDEDRLGGLYKNAVSRAIEVGFRYIELAADDFLTLHQLIHLDSVVMVRRIFEEAVSCMNDQSVLAFRPPSHDPGHIWAKMFLEMGGDMVRLEMSSIGGVCMDGLDPGAILTRLDRPTKANGVLEILKHARLVGLSAGFKDKQSQILEYLNLV